MKTKSPDRMTKFQTKHLVQSKAFKILSIRLANAAVAAMHKTTIEIQYPLCNQLNRVPFACVYARVLRLIDAPDRVYSVRARQTCVCLDIFEIQFFRHDLFSSLHKMRTFHFVILKSKKFHRIVVPVDFEIKSQIRTVD